MFAGRLTPVILGQPAEWIAPLLQALSLDAEGHGEAAQALREQAFDAAPAVPGGSAKRRSPGWQMPTRASARCSR